MKKEVSMQPQSAMPFVFFFGILFYVIGLLSMLEASTLAEDRRGEKCFENFVAFICFGATNVSNTYWGCEELIKEPLGWVILSVVLTLIECKFLYKVFNRAIPPPPSET